MPNHESEGKRESQRALEHAQEVLQETDDLVAEARKEIRELKKTKDLNHFTYMVRKAMQKRFS